MAMAMATGSGLLGSVGPWGWLSGVAFLLTVSSVGSFFDDVVSIVDVVEGAGAVSVESPGGWCLIIIIIIIITSEPHSSSLLWMVLCISRAAPAARFRGFVVVDLHGSMAPSKGNTLRDWGCFPWTAGLTSTVS